MKKLTFYLGFIGSLLIFSQCQTNQIEFQPESKSLDKRTRADLAAMQNFEMTRDPKTNRVPREELWKATELLRKQAEFKGKAVISDLQWTERGPNNVGGRTRAIMFDPNDPAGRRAFAGGVAGGLWVTDNIFATEPVWEEVDPFLDNLAITTLAHDPIDTDTMYMGTGEGYFNADATRGDGIWRSTDGGATWSQLANSTSYDYIQNMVVDSNGHVFAATRSSGVVRSTDAGATWSVALNASGTPTTNTVSDIELASNGDLYAAFGILFYSDGIYKSTDGGNNWTKVYTSSGEQRIELACAPSDSNYIYMITQNSSNYSANAVRRSTDGGSNWSNLSNPNSTTGGNFAGSQAWYDLSLAVDPNDRDAVYMGGIDLYKTTNGGSSWTQVSHWYGGGSLPEVHADQHRVVFSPGSSDSILFGNDGGIYLTTSGTSSTPQFIHQVLGYNVTQFYGGAIHPTSGSYYLLAGAQDNGSHQYEEQGMNSTREVTGGDGAFCHIDQNNPNYQFTQYVYNQFRRSTDGGASFSNVNFSSGNGKFINPTDYDNDAFIMYSSWNNGVYMRWTDPRTGTSAATVSFGTGSTGEPSALTCDPNTANRLYIGTDDGEIWRIDNAHSTITDTDITGGSMPSGYVSSIDVEKGNPAHLLVTFSNYNVTSVWESTDTGNSWTNVEGNLPNIPVRWGIFSPTGGDSAFLATELGVWTTNNLNGGSTSWGASNTGMANVRTDMLQWREVDSTIVAFTHGRGSFSLSLSQIVNPEFSANTKLVYPFDSIQFSDGSTGATSWKWDFNNDGIFDATTQNPKWAYKKGGYKSVKLVINNSDTIIKTDYITVLPKLGTPYVVADGGSFETNTWHFGSKSIVGPNLWERGAPSNALTTVNSGTNAWKTDLDADVPQEASICYLYTPSFNLMASGSYTLSFRKSMERQFSNAPYALIVEYSYDGGVTWNKLGTSPDANGTNWYGATGIDPSIELDGIGFNNNATNEATSYDISAFAGTTDLRFRFKFTVGDIWGGGYRDGFMIDDFTITGQTNEAYYPVETALNATATEYLGPNDSITYISNNGKIMATLINQSSHDYGATTVTIDNAGTGTMNFSTNTTTTMRIMEKTFYITPTTNNASGSVKIKTYYTNTEAGNWKTATGWNYINLNQIKSSSAITSANTSNTIYGTSPQIDSTYLSNNVIIDCSYSNGFSGIGAGADGTSGPLPVELISFSGSSVNEGVQLEWITASEINSDHFKVQRLSNGNFIDIGIVGAAGNSSEQLYYDFLDSDPAIANQTLLIYRLKMVDRDESYSYSRSVIVERQSPDILLGISPNPARDHLNLSINPLYNNELRYTIIDLRGITLQEDELRSSSIAVNQLSEGLYILILQRGDAVIAERKFMVTR